MEVPLTLLIAISTSVIHHLIATMLSLELPYQSDDLVIAHEILTLSVITLQAMLPQNRVVQFIITLLDL